MSDSVLNRYKLIGGPHIAEDVTADPLKDADGKPILKKDGSPKFPVVKFEAGSIVVSAEDLTRKHVNKFVFAGPYGGFTASPTSTPAGPSSPGGSTPKRNPAELEAMTVVDLRALAAEEEIDVSKAHLKAEIIAAILAAG